MSSCASMLRRYRTFIPILGMTFVLVFSVGQRCAAQNVEVVRQQPKESYLELYVNSKDQKHFTTVIDRVVRLQQSGKIPIATIYHIGDFNVVTPELRATLWRSKIKLFGLSEVPRDMPIKTSPAWVFVTLSGRRIVEGTLAIENFIDARGSFRDGSQMQDPVAASPTSPQQQMEGF